MVKQREAAHITQQIRVQQVYPSYEEDVPSLNPQFFFPMETWASIPPVNTLNLLHFQTYSNVCVCELCSNSDEGTRWLSVLTEMCLYTMHSIS